VEVGKANGVSGLPLKRKGSQNNSSLGLDIGYGGCLSKAEIIRQDWSPLLF